MFMHINGFFYLADLRRTFYLCKLSMNREDKHFKGSQDLNFKYIVGRHYYYVFLPIKLMSHVSF